MSKRNIIWLAAIVVIVLAFYRLAPMAAEQDSVHRAYAPLVEADALIRQRFVETIDDQRLIDGAIRGMMLKLDPYSGYIAPDELGAYRRGRDGSYTGIGVQLGVRDGQLTVIAPIEQSPAIDAGVQAGDVILAIDGTSTEGLSIVDVDRLLDGAPGSRVALRVWHAAGQGEETLTITRRRIDLHSIKGFRHNRRGGWDYWLDQDARVGYIRVTHFQKDTPEEFDRVFDHLRSAAVAGLIVDLRFNPGGSLTAAAQMVDRFIDRGLIVSTVTRHKAVDEIKARVEGTFPPVPLVVLINGSSASAAEIFSGALQDHDRAVIVGTRSFGKGVVQHVIELTQHRAAVKLTTAHYRLPNGRIIHKTDRNTDTDEWGVLPDLVVELSPQEVQAVRASRSELDRSLVMPTTAPASAPVATAATQAAHILVDAQLEAALVALLERVEAGETGGQRSSRRTTSPTG